MYKVLTTSSALALLLALEIGGAQAADIVLTDTICENYNTATDGGGGGESSNGITNATGWDPAGSGNFYTGANTACGYKNYVNEGYYATAIGAENTAYGSKDSKNALANHHGGTAIGELNVARGVLSTAIGSHNLAEDAYTTAVGYLNQATGWGSAVVGAFSTASGETSAAFGYMATATNTNAVAIGRNAQASVINSVALGSNSITQAAHIGEYTTVGAPSNIAARTSAGGTVSVGSSGNERQIQNVAAGVVSAMSTDAINGSQLYAVGTALNTAADGAAAGLGGGAAWDDVAGTWTSPTYSINGAAYNNVGDALGTVNDSANTLGYTTAAALGGGSVYTPGSGVSAPTYNIRGTDYEGVGLALVAVDDSLNNISNGGTKYFKANSSGPEALASGADSIAIGAGAVANSDNGVALGSNSVADGVHAGPYSINGGSVQATSSAGGVVSVGSSGKERQIQNVAAGVVSELSTDAINGSQLYAVGTAVNTAAGGAAAGLGGGAAWASATGVWTGPTYNINGAAHTDVGSALGAVNNNTNNLGTTAAAALGGGSTYTPGVGVSAPSYKVQGNTYNNVGSALGALDGGINSLQGQVNTLTAGVLGNSMSIDALSRGVQRGYEGTAVALATAGGNFLGEKQKYSLTGKFGTFRGQYGFGAVAQVRVNENVIAHAGVGGGVKYGGVGGFGGLTVGW